MYSNPNKAEAHKDMLSESCWVLKTMLMQKTPASRVSGICRNTPNTFKMLPRHLRHECLSSDSTNWTLLSLQSLLTENWEKRASQLQDAQKRESVDTRGSIPLGWDQEHLQGTMRRCPQHGRQQCSILCTSLNSGQDQSIFSAHSCISMVPDTCWILRNSVKLLQWGFAASPSDP